MKSVGGNTRHRTDRCCLYIALPVLIALCIVGFGCRDRATKSPFPEGQRFSVPPPVETPQSRPLTENGEGTIEWRGVDSHFSHTTKGK